MAEDFSLGRPRPAAGFGVRELAPALESGGKPPHSKDEGEWDFGADLLERCPDLQQLKRADPLQLRKLG
jgi:hypothetical protein